MTTSYKTRDFKSPLSREAYEAACEQTGADAKSDQDCNSYGVRHGDFSYPEYDAAHIMKMHLARLRMQAMDESNRQKTSLSPVCEIPKMQGQIWEGCEQCGSEPSYLPLHLCGKCWPKNSIK